MEEKCFVCGRPATCKVHGMLLCPKHNSQWYRHHEFNDQTIYAPNDYIYHDDYVEIVLRNKHCEDVAHAIIDVDDVEKCKKYKWHLSHGRYVIATIPNGTKVSNEKMHLHRLITGYDGHDFVTDHINRNPLDNRKCNLRIVSQQVNAANKGDAGVKLVPSGRYQAIVTRHYKPIYIGTFDTYDEAMEARKAFIAEYDANDPLRVDYTAS